MADIRQFSAGSQQRIADAVRLVEQSPILRTPPTRRDVSPSAREVRWARTTTSYAWPSYPTEGPVYVVEFGEYIPSPDPPYPGASVTNSFTPYDPEWKEIAVDPSGGKWDQGTVVRVERHEGRWWIRPAAAAATTPQIWTIASSNTTTYTWHFFQAGSSTRDTTPPIEITSAGVYCFPRFYSGTGSNANGTVFTLVTSPSGVSGGLYCIKFQQKATFAITSHTVWRLPPLSESTANSHLRAASHQHEVTISGTTYNTSSTTIDALAKDSKNGVSVETVHRNQTVGRSSIPYFYNTSESPGYYRWATHSGVSIHSPSSSPPQDVSIYVSRILNTDDYVTCVPELDSITLMIEQLTDVEP